MATYLTTLRGTIAAGSVGEIFSHSLGIQSSATADVVATAVRDAWTTAFTTGTSPLNTMFPEEIVYTEATAAVVIDQVVPNLGAAFHAPFSGGLPGVQTGSMLPPQTALAVSLRAGVRPNGAPLKGRFYLPTMTTAAMLPDGTVNPGTAQGVLDQIKVFMDALFAASHWPCVWSRTVANLVGVVDQIRVGDRFDTIRSRRNASPELYLVATPVGPQ